MPLFRRSSAQRDGAERAAAFVRAAYAEPDAADIRWLAEVATGGDEDHARWELRYARRALALLTAQHDALDDRTGSLVAQALDAALARDPLVGVQMAPLAARQFNDRLTAYRDALDMRSTESTGMRLGRVLLVFAGSVRAARGAALAPAAVIADRYHAEANVALRQAFGTASLPDDQPPSTVAPR